MSELPESDCIAIGGIGIRLPGSIQTPASMWKFLLQGRDARKPIPSDRWNSTGFDDSLGWKGAIKNKHGYFLDEDIATFDASAFSMTRAEVEKCDPQQRLLLEVVRECLEDAGEVNYRGARIACYVGTSGEDWLRMGAYEPLHVGNGVMSGGSDIMLANRVSYEYNLTGPSLIIKTGCSASLVALHDACNAIRSGSATAAIVAGTALNMDPTQTTLMTGEGILSPDGSCKPFDASANGFARAEAINAIFIKPLSRALEHGNPVRAVIRAIGSNNDGRSNGFAQPNGVAQEQLIRRVYAAANLDISKTAFVECHGTGTPVGDPIEVNAIGEAFGGHGVLIGSHKANLGHSEAASGISGVIKAVLALQHRTIPPQIKFETPNPKIPFEAKNLSVAVVASPFSPDKSLRVSVNSFGIGGSNAHAVIEAFDVSPGVRRIASDRPELLLHSAHSPRAVEQRVTQHEGLFLEKNDSHFGYDLAFTLATRRTKDPYRAFSIVQAGQVGQTYPPLSEGARERSLVMVFSGQGAQWPQMARGLIEQCESFRADLDRMTGILQKLPEGPSWNIIEEMQKPELESSINTAQMAQPLSTAIQVATVNLLRSLGIFPPAVIGHSSGEICAAYAAGHISLEDAITIAYYRGLAASQASGGGMAAVSLGKAIVASLLLEDVIVACDNSPESSTISGPSESLDKAEKLIKDKYPEVFYRKLRVDQAYHSSQMREAGRRYMSLMRHHRFGNGDVLPGCKGGSAFFSTVYGSRASAESTMAPEYWRENLTSPVQFNETVKLLLAEESDRLFLEIGPAPVLAGPLRQISSSMSCTTPYINVLDRGKDGYECFLRALGSAFQHGVVMDLEPLWPKGRVLQDLPLYPWDRSTSFWCESRLSRARRMRKYGPHSLLGVEVPECTDDAPTWRNVLHLENEPWLGDHRIGKDIIFPFAGYVAMAGEAIRQLMNGHNAYTVEKMSVNAAMVIPRTEGLEVVTRLTRRRFTDSAFSVWWDFSISANKNGSWRAHAMGRISTQLEQPRSTFQALHDEELPRQVPRSYFYETLGSMGLNFGREFQRLRDIRSTTNPTCTRAHAEVVTFTSDPSDQFTCHPGVMDAAFQLLAVAKWTGLPRNFNPPVAPMYAERITVFPSSAKTHIVNAVYARNPSITSNRIEIQGDDGYHLSMSGVTLKPIPTSLNSDSEHDKHAAARLQWLPDITFLDPSTLIQGKPLLQSRNVRLLTDQYMLLCIIETSDALGGLQPCQPYLSRYREWLKARVKLAEADSIPLVPDSKRLAAMSRVERSEKMQEIRGLLTRLSAPSSVQCAERVLKNARDIFIGVTDPLECLTEGQLLSKTYTEASIDLGPYIKLLAHKRPNLRILEVGAGTGGTTEGILRALTTEGDLPAYSTYTFTDVSSAFFPAAAERFDFAPNLDFKIFDVTRSPAGQELDLKSYDLVVACNVIHATPVLSESLAHIRELLKPDGQVIVTELCKETQNATYIFGQLPTWWVGKEKHRQWSPLASTPQWDVALREAGFSGVAACILDDEEPFQLCATIVSNVQSVRDSTATHCSGIAILCSNPDSACAQALTLGLNSLGWQVTSFRLEDEIPEGSNVVSCIDLESVLMDDLNPQKWTQFQRFLKRSERRRILWLTIPTQIACSDPRAAPSLGMLRTARNELNLELFTLEICAEDPNLASHTSRLLQRVLVDGFSSGLQPDREYAVIGNTICVGRYQAFSVANETTRQSLSSINTRIVASAEQPGSIDSIGWNVVPNTNTLEDDAVEIEVQVVGLNFADVLRAMGMIESLGDADGMSLGFEFSGVVQNCGKDVHSTSPGARVVGFAPDGCLSSTVRTKARLVTSIPEHLAFDEAATIPCCFATVWLALMTVARLQKGQSVLIHSAAGGVGLAALQVCRLAGADVHVTVGTQEKVEFLINHCGLPASRIYCSRDTSFVDAVFQQTDGRGVDVVLNSLSGDLLRASWQCVAPYGVMVELGKQDLQSNGSLDMRPFLANRTYTGVDLLAYTKEKPEEVGRLLADLIALYREGRIQPLSPYTKFDQLIPAFRHLQSGSHIGKVVVDVSSGGSVLPLRKKMAASLNLRPDVSYLLTGGLGGLGRSMATWLVENGARNLTFLSRSAGMSDTSQQMEAELLQMGCNVTMVPGRVDDLADVQRAIKSSLQPLGGIFHLAMVLQDVSFEEMTFEQLIAVTTPKIQGAWNLHNACKDMALDFFWMGSSVNTVFDQPGQANYAAANTFLESFVQYRHSLGLPASTINICPISGVGYVAENQNAKRICQSMGVILLGEKTYLECLHLALLQSKPVEQKVTPPWVDAWANPSQFVMGLRPDRDLHDSNNHTVWRLDRRMGYYHNVRQGTTQQKRDDSDELDRLLIQLNHDVDVLALPESKLLIAKKIGQRIFDFMMVQNEEEIDPGLRLKDLGLDSLMSIELRRWFRQVFGIEVTVLEILDADSLLSLADCVVVEKLQQRLVS